MMTPKPADVRKVLLSRPDPETGERRVLSTYRREYWLEPAPRAPDTPKAARRRRKESVDGR